MLMDVVKILRQTDRPPRGDLLSQYQSSAGSGAVRGLTSQ